jgi:hypothetical protein
VGWVYRRRVRLGKNAWLNLSKRGVGESVRVGPVTYNSRGRRSVRVAKGLSYRSGCALPLLLAAACAAVALPAAARTIRSR